METIQPKIKNTTINEPLNQIEGRFKDILRTLSDFIWKVDENCTFTWCSGAAEDIFGVSDEALTGKNIFDFMPAEEAQRTKNIIKEIFLKKEPIENLEAYHDDRHGKRHWLCINGIPIFDKKGILKGYTGICRDISSQKKAEESLRESELKFRTLVDEAFDGVVIHDGQRMIEVNKAFCSQWGYAPGEAAGLLVAKFFAPECWEEVRKRIESGYDKPYEAIAIRKNGTRFQAEIIAKTITYKNRTMRIASTRDITKHKQAKLALEASEIRYRSLFEQAADAIVIFDPQTQEIVEFNNKANEMLGYTRDEFSQLKLSDIEAIESAEEVAIHINRITKQGGDMFETKQRKKNGTLCNIRVNTNLITIAGKQYIQGIWRDITHIKNAEKQLMEYQKQLKHLAARLTLTEERERRQIARGLHDHVGQSLALAKIKLDILHTAETSEPLVKIIEEVSRSLEEAISDMRSLTFDLSYPILYELGFEAAVAEWLNVQIRDKHGIEVEFKDDGLAKPLDDDMRIILFRNARELFINIIKHANADKIRVQIRKIDNSLELTVKDNGIGFTPTETRIITSKAGFGLLSIRESIEELGGHFEIESKHGAGCKAVITAPLKGIKRKMEE